MTIDLDALEALIAEATPRPWHEEYSSRSGYEVWSDTGMRLTANGHAATFDKANAALIVAAVNNLPALIARVRELEREQATLRAALAIAQEDRRAAAIAMRERCAKVCERWGEAHDDGLYEADQCAAAIRALEP